MKNLYAVLVLVFCSFVSNAQIVNIPDVNFKNKLLNYQPVIDTNNDGEIQVSEALTLTEINFYAWGILDMTGIEAFTNLITLNCSYNYNLNSINVSTLVNLETLNCSDSFLSVLDVSNLPSLKFLNCSNNNLNTMDLSGLTNLEELYCTNNQLSSINVSGLTNLKSLVLVNNNLNTLELSELTSLIELDLSSNNIEVLNISNLINLQKLYCNSNLLNSLDVTNLNNLTVLNCSQNMLNTINISNQINLKTFICSNNQITNLNISNCINLIGFYCSNNQITNLNISNCINLLGFDCSNNQLSVLDFTNLTKLVAVVLSNNLFTSIDLSHIIPSNNFYFYDFSSNPFLNSINLKNGARLTSENGSAGGEIPLYSNDCPNLLYICADEFNFQYIQVPNAQLNTYCSFNPGGNYNTITGTFSLDNDNNGCDVNDYKFSDSKIKINDVSNIFGATYTNTSGKYNFFTQAGNFIITPEFENPYFTVSPPTATINFADSNNNTQTQNFCVTPNGVHNDVEVSVLPLERPRPGFDATYQLVYKNKGNQVLSGNVNLTFNDAVLDFVAANPALATQSLNTLSWSYANLLPFESRTINFTLNVNSPQEIPAVNIGDILSFSASIDPISGDETVNDNTFALTQTVLGSYDPNDKTCLEGNTIVPERIGEYLHYLIRFQNSGTAAAENIVVKDIIDTTKFDITSLQLTSASHNYTTKITGNKVEFIFENINLPAEIDNEAASHGFVAFKIKTKNNLTAGNSVSNKADIYFDYNFPITTNEATTTFATLGVNQIENKSVAVFPNPVQDILTITSKGNLTSIQLLDV